MKSNYAAPLQSINGPYREPCSRYKPRWEKAMPINKDEEIEFLRLIKDRVDNLIPKVSINTPLMEISIMLGSRLAELERS